MKAANGWPANDSFLAFGYSVTILLVSLSGIFLALFASPQLMLQRSDVSRFAAVLKVAHNP
jgi:hypothetical protein